MCIQAVYPRKSGAWAMCIPSTYAPKIWNVGSPTPSVRLERGGPNSAPLGDYLLALAGFGSGGLGSVAATTVGATVTPLAAARLASRNRLTSAASASVLR